MALKPRIAEEAHQRKVEHVQKSSQAKTRDTPDPQRNDRRGVAYSSDHDGKAKPPDKTVEVSGHEA